MSTPNIKPATPVQPVGAQRSNGPVPGSPEAIAAARKESEKETLSLQDIEGAFMLPAELSDASAPVRARNDKQQAMDKKVKELHAAWVKAGKPANWAKMVEGRSVATYFVEPDKAPELHKLINRAVVLHGLRSRMGTSFRVTEKHVAQFGLPSHYVGREAVSFAILDKRPRATSDGKPASEVVNKPAAAPAPPAKK